MNVEWKDKKVVIMQARGLLLIQRSHRLRQAAEKTGLIFILLLNSILAVQAQDNFKLGYIITNENDTVNGWIDYRTDAQNGTICRFKASENASLQPFLPGSIYGYRFIEEGKFYISKPIELNGVSRVVFLEFLVQGIINLYHYTDLQQLHKEEYYFFEDESGKMTTIAKRPDELVKNETGRTVRKVDNAYKGVVRYLFQDSRSVVDEIDRLAFKPESMIEITKNYHGQVCTTGESCIIFESTPDKHYTLFRFSVFGGMQIYQANYIDPVFSPFIGGGMNVSVPRLNEYVSLQLDAYITKVSTSKIFPTKGSPFLLPTKGPPCIYELDQILVPVTLGCKYTYSKYRLCPSVSLGGTFHVYMNRDERITQDQIRVADLTWYNNAVYFGLHAAIGLEYMLSNRRAVFISTDFETIPTFNAVSLPIKIGYTF